jgi:hypothetical protein
VRGARGSRILKLGLPTSLGLARLAGRGMPTGTMTNHRYEPDPWLMLGARLLVKKDELMKLERARRGRVKRQEDTPTQAPGRDAGVAPAQRLRVR